MDAPRWEWTLPGGERVAATLDAASGDEVVLSGDRVLSRATRASKTGGHVIAVRPIDGREGESVVVKFEPHAPICFLRIGNEEITPLKFHVPKRAVPPVKKAMPVGIFLVMGIVLLAAAGALGIARVVAAARHGEGTSEQERAKNGLFIAHFSGSFAPRPVVAPSGMSALLLEQREKEAAVLILALPWSEGAHDPWDVMKRLQGEALAALPRATGNFEETARRDDTCLGERGAVSLGRGTTRKGDTSRVWSCAFVHKDGAYLVTYQLREAAPAEEEIVLRGVVDATELTHLDELPASSSRP